MSVQYLPEIPAVRRRSKELFGCLVFAIPCLENDPTACRLELLRFVKALIWDSSDNCLLSLIACIEGQLELGAMSH